ncbi:MAG: TrbG/VirB9 family P-type conjugative transfer protein [Acidobacteriota bacterium]|nr:TrbG/VirB9 family P-type conjugative transfer protein [Acidobacteriota bacterium]
MSAALLRGIPFSTFAFLVACWTLLPGVATGSGVLRIKERQDQIVEIRTKVRHTSVLVLPKTENILDFVVGDSDYWHLSGAANLAYLKPIATGVRTNVTLVCASGRIYAFLASEGAESPHLVVRIERSGGGDGRAADAPHKPAFVSRSMVEGYQHAARQASEAALAAKSDAETRVNEAKQEAAKTIDQFRSDYPARLKWPYRLEKRAFERPFLVEALWHDGQFTYLRCRAQEAPALYELKDGSPSLVSYDLSQDGLYVVRHVLGDGWLAIGKSRAKWRFVDAGLRP